MKRRSILKSIAALPAITRLEGAPPYRTWLGSDFWANPLQDWRKNGPRWECHVSGGDRNVFWLSREIGSNPSTFAMSVRLGNLSPLKGESGWVGFRTGMRGFFDDYRDTAIRGLGLECGITSQGRLFIGTVPKDGPTLTWIEDLTLTLEATANQYRLSAGGLSIEATVPTEWLSGGVALVCHSGDTPTRLPRMGEPFQANTGKPNQNRGGDMRFWFQDWKLEGPGVVARPERAWGPILFAQHTVHAGVLKMSVQLAPLEGDEGPATLRLGSAPPINGQVDVYSSLASFRVEGYQATRDTPYTLSFAGATYQGTIRKDPKANNDIRVGALTCQGDFGFPHAPIARSMKTLKPDVLFFTGDQLYEANGGYGIQRQPAEAARLDYLRKWYMFGWAWGELTRNTPCICLPDDHDVYHGNLWGSAGRRAEYPPPGGDPQFIQQDGQDSGGYLMPAGWVNMVQKTQSSHLPDSPDARPVDQEITVHYGELVWGGISFAILEDRKWKSAPKSLLPEAKIRNGWPQNPKWVSATQGDVPNAQLLGERQERFLAKWADSWPEGVEMKAAVSATIFCNLATLPKDAMSDAVTSRLPVEPLGGYARNEKFTEDHDSNGWPQTPRNRALRSLRSCLAVHIAGDQHLASTIQYGIDSHRDGPFAICTPAISNIFPRRWYPPQAGENRNPNEPNYTGDFFDGFGNRLTVHAVGNPQQFGQAPKALHDRAPGFGLVTFDKAARQIRLENYPRWADLSKATPQHFPGWPITINQQDNGLNGAQWMLRLPAKVSGLIRVTSQGSDAAALVFRSVADLDQIPIWAEGVYRITAGKRVFSNLRAEKRVTTG